MSQPAFSFTIREVLWLMVVVVIAAQDSADEPTR